MNFSFLLKTLHEGGNLADDDDDGDDEDDEDEEEDVCGFSWRNAGANLFTTLELYDMNSFCVRSSLKRPSFAIALNTDSLFIGVTPAILCRTVSLTPFFSMLLLSAGNRARRAQRQRITRDVMPPLMSETTGWCAMDSVRTLTSSESPANLSCVEAA